MTSFLFGALHLSVWGYVIATLILTQITIAAVTIYLHRCQAHRALTLHPIVSHFFRFWLWLTTGMVTKEWAAIHRKHHAKCETAEDPHSPQILGLNTVMWNGVELYRFASLQKETMERYGHGTPDDWVERNVYSKYTALGLALMFVIDAILFGIPGIAIWAIQMMWIPFFAAGVVNGVAHYWGYRNFECRDASRNLIPWGFWIGGEELHNNHHTYPTSAKLSVKWWEFDMGWFYIKLLSYLKLAHPKKIPPRLQRIQGKSNVDVDTVKAVITNRFQILSQYTKEVILPVLSMEKQKTTCAQSLLLLEKAKAALVRAESLLDAKAKLRLKEALENSHALKQVYQYQQALMAVWDKTSLTHKELMEVLQQWCQQAELSGQEALRRFALQLKTVN